VHLEHIPDLACLNCFKTRMVTFAKIPLVETIMNDEIVFSMIRFHKHGECGIHGQIPNELFILILKRHRVGTQNTLLRIRDLHLKRINGNPEIIWAQYETPLIQITIRDGHDRRKRRKLINDRMSPNLLLIIGIEADSTGKLEARDGTSQIIDEA